MHHTTADRSQVSPPSVDISALPSQPVGSSSPTVVVPGQHTLSIIVARLALPEFCTVLLSHWPDCDLVTHPNSNQASSYLTSAEMNTD